MGIAEKSWHPITRLDVIYQGWGEEFILGTLAAAPQRGRYMFEYSGAARERGIEFSPIHQPLSTETFTNFERYQEGIPGFIFDSLPDGWGRLLVDRLLRRNQINPHHLSPLDRLTLPGDAAMGALVYRPSIKLEDQNDDFQDIRNLSGLAEQIRLEISGQASEALSELVRLGGSPHGARPKALVEYDPFAECIGTHPFSGSIPWLVKFPGADESSYVCALEEIYTQLARAAGIDFPESKWFPLENGLAAFGVRRFDRDKGRRIPVASVAGILQADFTLPSLDYIDILRATAQITRSVKECEIQARRMIFNVIMNNRDDHAKNFSFVYNEQDEWQVSQAYDLTFQEGPGGEHQTSVAGHGRDISLKMLTGAAAKADISEKFIKETTQQICEVADSFSHIASQAEFKIPRPVVKTLSARIAHNIASL